MNINLKSVSESTLTDQGYRTSRVIGFAYCVDLSSWKLCVGRFFIICFTFLKLIKVKAQFVIQYIYFHVFFLLLFHTTKVKRNYNLFLTFYHLWLLLQFWSDYQMFYNVSAPKSGIFFIDGDTTNWSGLVMLVFLRLS